MRTSERSFGPAPATRSAGAQALESSFRLEKTGLSGNEPRILPNLQRILISKGRIFSLGCRHADKKKGRINSSPSEFWSGRRVSNSRPQPWQGCALPTELLPHQDIAAPSKGIVGAGDESRTRDLNHGKVALYQLSYSRMSCEECELYLNQEPCQGLTEKKIASAQKKAASDRLPA